MSLVVQATGADSAPAIVFLHGLGVSSWMWTEQVAALSADYQCLAIDLPGNGESYRETWHSLADSASQVAAIIRAQAAHGKAHIVGLSLGGYVALQLLADHPDVVETVLVSGISTKGLTPAWLYKALVFVVSPLMQWQPYINMNIKMMQLPADAAVLFTRDNKRVRGATLRAIFNEITDFKLPSGLQGRGQRLLAVAGKLEAKAIQAGLSAFPQALPQGAAALVPDAHHGWNGEHPQLFNDMIRAWVTGQPLPNALEPVLAASSP